MELEQANVEKAFMGLFDKYVYEPVLKYQGHMDKKNEGILLSYRYAKL